MKKLVKYISVIALTLGLFNACGKSGSEVKYVTIKGSDTMVHLASNWAEDYMKSHPNTDISVTGGGSGTGIAALLNGTTDICIASRKIKQKELDKAKELNINPREFSVARDGIALAVNPENPVSSLSIEQIGKIFKGAYTNWKDVGGPDQTIVILSRESSSGTYVFFQKRVMNKADYTTEAMLMPSTSSIIQTVSQDKGAIGYVGLGYALEAKDKIKVLTVKETDDAAAVNPSIQTVQSGAYPISRPLHFYTNGDPAGEVKNVIDFCFSKEGQKIVLETGYVPVN
jgi:phosphate transport system substrate-binding protein